MLEVHFLWGSLDITLMGHMTIIDAEGGTYKYSFHKNILFTFLNVGEQHYQTRELGLVTRWFQMRTLKKFPKRLMKGMMVMRQEKKMRATRLEERRISKLRQQPSFEMGSSLSSAHGSFGDAFLQSFSNFLLEVVGLYPDYTVMRQDVNRIANYMDRGITYFRGFVECQEEREMARAKREEQRQP